MNGLNFFKSTHIERLISKRNGEQKFGERLQFVANLEELKTHKAKYVLLGIPEDIGVRANFGKPGTSRAWKTTLSSLVNIQVNQFNDPKNLILLGEVDCNPLMKRASLIDESDPNYHAKLGDLVKETDQLVSEIIAKIVGSGKIPIIIGGGHNNAYGNIKGSAKALKKPLNVLNIDAHTDLRQLEHRHSGNGFSYAIEGLYLNKYSIFGLHKNYTPEYIFKGMEASPNINFKLLEDLSEEQGNISDNFQQMLQGINDSSFGFELDCDAIADFPSSAKSPSGFSVDQVRNFLRLVSKDENCCYFHICEAAPEEDNSAWVGKALSYFISDFISA